MSTSGVAVSLQRDCRRNGVVASQNRKSEIAAKLEFLLEVEKHLLPWLMFSSQMFPNL